jgi:hypothetical protein
MLLQIHALTRTCTRKCLHHLHHCAPVSLRRRRAAFGTTWPACMRTAQAYTYKYTQGMALLNMQTRAAGAQAHPKDDHREADTVGMMQTPQPKAKRRRVGGSTAPRKLDGQASRTVDEHMAVARSVLVKQEGAHAAGHGHAACTQLDFISHPAATSAATPRCSSAAPDKKPKRKTKSKTKAKITFTPPADWQAMWSLIKELRATRDAPVDLYGSEALPEKDQGDAVRATHLPLA